MGKMLILVVASGALVISGGLILYTRFINRW